MFESTGASIFAKIMSGIFSALKARAWSMALAAFLLASLHELVWPTFFAETGNMFRGRVLMACALWVLAAVGINEIGSGVVDVLAQRRLKRVASRAAAEQVSRAAEARVAKLSLLKQLPEDAKAVLKDYVSRNVRSLEHRPSNAAVLFLEKRGHLHRLSAPGNAGRIICEIDDDVWNALRERPELLDASPPQA
jgi:hypothetical protein